jgi:hypothetical protein
MWIVRFVQKFRALLDNAPSSIQLILPIIAVSASGSLLLAAFVYSIYGIAGTIGNLVLLRSDSKHIRETIGWTQVPRARLSEAYMSKAQDIVNKLEGRGKNADLNGLVLPRPKDRCQYSTNDAKKLLYVISSYYTILGAAPSEEEVVSVMDKDWRKEYDLIQKWKKRHERKLQKKKKVAKE